MLPVLCIAAVTEPYSRVCVGASGLEEQVVPAVHTPLLGVWMAGCETAKKEMCEEICGGCR